jgi:tRNA threonylcarbamoyladenosine biosynthesis protein TsaB
MFPLLTLESCSTHLSAAVFLGAQECVQEISPPDGRAHSEKILLLIQQLLSRAELELKHIKSLGVSRGPGSFTSLRMGVATQMGFALSLNLPLFACSSLEALAHKAGHSCVAPFLKAGRGQVYCAGFKRSNNFDSYQLCLPESALMPPEFIKQMLELDSQTIFCGPDVTALPDVEAKQVIPDAASVGALIISNPIPLDLNKFQLNYLKQADVG